MHDDPDYSLETFIRNIKHMFPRKTSPKNPKPRKSRRWFLGKHFWKNTFLLILISFFLIASGFMLWVAFLRIPDLQSLQEKVLAGSTRIYDRTGQILLYDLNQDVKREVVPFGEISQHVKDATISIEDEKFYEHKGIELISIVRAVLVDIQHMRLSQGGSTITQQIIKNSLLTSDKKISRKIKEWVLALKLERIMSKDEILNLYLNSTPYGGSYYGIETASQNYLGKSAKDLGIAESAYLAALPQAPSYYSPYGNHRQALDNRKNIVLLKMRENGYITEAEYTAARAEKIAFKPPENRSIKAPHFVMFVKDYLTDTYGEDVIKNNNLRVITTLDYELQQKAEEIVKKYALENEKKFNASNAALIAIDPTTGQILSMVGSRDYFDKKIDGNFNVTLAHRQPGSAFKPFAYATAFSKGYTPDTVLFDLPTQFSTTCDADGKPLSPSATCYSPQNYDLQFVGPISLRNALAQSRNIPAIKTLYLAGLSDTLQTARDLGITSLKNINQYGLTLVLGGGEVSPLEMTSAYSVFANDGLRNPHTSILSITDKSGRTLEEYKPNAARAMPEQTALLINNILSDNNARLALNGPGSATDFPADKEVALKTGTTNDYRDTWIIGYTPTLAVGAWAGNNNNTPMIKKTSGMIIAPLWRAFMDEALKKYSPQPFKRPEPTNPALKPILRGLWQGGQIYVIDKTSGKLATDLTPAELRQEVAAPNIHTILYWIDKNNPTGPAPARPENDSQFNLWEKPVQAWVYARSAEYGNFTPPTQTDDTHDTASVPRISILSPMQGSSFNSNDKIVVAISNQSRFPLVKADFYLNNNLIGTASADNLTFSFIPQELPFISSSNTLRVTVYDSVQNKAEAQTTFIIRK